MVIPDFLRVLQMLLPMETKTVTMAHIRAGSGFYRCKNASKPLFYINR